MRKMKHADNQRTMRPLSGKKKVGEMAPRLVEKAKLQN